MRKNVCPVLFFLLILFPALAARSDGYDESVEVEVVNVYVTATDGHNHFVTDLSPGDFVIRENNIEQEIEDFRNFADDHGTKKIPLTLEFLLDGSSSMAITDQGKARIDVLKEAMVRFLDQLNSVDRIKVSAFTNFPRDVAPMTSDLQFVKQKVKEMAVRGGKTAIYDSLDAALQEMKQYGGRKVVVLCTDGMDTASHLTFEQILQQVKASDVTILAFGSAPPEPNETSNRFVLSSIAETSGGYAFFPESEGKIASILDNVRLGMKSQYLISYSPRRTDTAQPWRQIQVVTKRPGIRLRYREGYFLE